VPYELFSDNHGLGRRANAHLKKRMIRKRIFWLAMQVACR
jgi:hypothetical protein